MTDIWQNLAGQETAKRAIEIAMVGGLPITFAAREGYDGHFTPYDIDRLKGEARSQAQARYDWYEGKPMSLEAAADTVAHVRAIADDLAARCGLPALDTAHDDAAMRIDITPTSLADLVSPPPQEPIDTVVWRVMKGLEKLLSIKRNLTPEAEGLRANWAGCVPTARVDEAIEVARSIAALGGYVASDVMEGGPQISRMCLAEAISYCGR